MNQIKERLIGAITVMSNEEAQNLWEWIVSNHLEQDWDSIEEVVPDEIDLQMIHEAENNPDCLEMASLEDVRRVLGDIQR